MSKAGNQAQVIEFVRAARADKAPFEIVAGGTRRSVGHPVGDLPLMDVSGLCGIVKYEPEELIITAGPATPLAEIKAVLAERGQRLGFDPADWSRLLKSNGTATLAGAASCDASGSGRLRHGGARDSLLGFALNTQRSTLRKQWLRWRDDLRVVRCPRSGTNLTNETDRTEPVPPPLRPASRTFLGKRRH